MWTTTRLTTTCNKCNSIVSVNADLFSEINDNKNQHVITFTCPICNNYIEKFIL